MTASVPLLARVSLDALEVVGAAAAAHIDAAMTFDERSLWAAFASLVGREVRERTMLATTELALACHAIDDDSEGAELVDLSADLDDAAALGLYPDGPNAA